MPCILTVNISGEGLELLFAFSIVFTWVTKTNLLYVRVADGLWIDQLCAQFRLKTARQLWSFATVQGQIMSKKWLMNYIKMVANLDQLS